MFESMNDIRRRAPFHFSAKADNARLSAFALSHFTSAQMDALKLEANYGGATALALYEGFRREASIAIELILKAILCITKNEAPPKSHDVFELWKEAELPELDKDNCFRLVEMSEILYWSGRYAAPISDKKYHETQELLDQFSRKKHLGGLTVRRPTPLEWEHFDVLYRIAQKRFWELDPNKLEHTVRKK